LVSRFGFAVVRFTVTVISLLISHRRSRTMVAQTTIVAMVAVIVRETITVKKVRS
jgi:hypothetical protein